MAKKVNPYTRAGSGLPLDLDHEEVKFLVFMMKQRPYNPHAKSILKKVKNAESRPHEEEL